MAKLTTQTIALCDLALITREGKLAVIGIFDQIMLREFPGGIICAFFVATIIGEPKTQYIMSLQTKHNDKIVAKMGNMIVTTSANGKNNIMFDLVNLGFPEAGDYFFEIICGPEVIGSYKLTVSLFEEPEKAEQQRYVGPTVN